MDFRVYKNNKTKQKQTKQTKQKKTKQKQTRQNKKTGKTEREVECTPQVNLQVAPENSWYYFLDGSC